MKQMGARQWDTKGGQSKKRSGDSDGNGKKREASNRKEAGKDDVLTHLLTTQPLLSKPALHY